MILRNPSLILTFMGGDLPSGHSTTQTVGYEYIINRSVNFDKLLLNGLKSASNQAMLQLSKECISTEDIIATDGDIKATLKDGATTLFTGYVSTNFSWRVTHNGEQALAITLEDTSVRLLSKPFIETGYHLFDCSVTAAAEAICEAAGIIISSSAITINDAVLKVVDASRTCREILDQMLYEAGYVYYCDNLGELRFFKVDCSSTSGIPVIDKTKLFYQNGQAVNLTKKIRQYRSVRLTYKEVATSENYLVYRNTTDADDAHPFCNLPLAAGEHYDGLEIYTAEEWAEETADQFREDALIEACNAASETDIVGSNKIISISNVKSEIQKSSQIAASITGAGGPYLKIDCNNSGLDGSITRLDAYASIVFEKSTNIVRAGVDGTLTDALFSEEVEYIHSKDQATRHANLLCQFFAYCNSQYTFHTDEDITLGSIIRLNEDVFTGLDVTVLVIGKKESTGSSVATYTAIGISVFDLNKKVYHRATDSGNSNTKGQKGTEWHDGTALTGKGKTRGFAGEVGDFYLNKETGDVYRCISTGSVSTAVWEWTTNIKGKDADITSQTYTIEYGLSTSDKEFIFPSAEYGYDEDNSFGYDTDKAFGFKNYAWGDNYADWYHGLFVWTRIKITHKNGVNTYEEPRYAKELTQSLIESCIIDLAAIPDAYVSNARRTDRQHLSLTVRNIGYRGTLTLYTMRNDVVFSRYDPTTGEWTDLNNTLTMFEFGPQVLTEYGLSIPYAISDSLEISGTFSEIGTGDSIPVKSLGVSPSIAKTNVVQLTTVDCAADLPDHVNIVSPEVTVGDNLINGDYILVKFLTLTAINTSQARDETGKVWEFGDLSSYYSDVSTPISISAFVQGNTYYAFCVLAWTHNGVQWVREASSAVEINTVKEAVDLAQIQHDTIDSSVNYFKCLYAHRILVQKLTAGVLEVGKILVNDIESINYQEDSNGTPTTGYKLIHNGGENGDGEIKSVGGVFADMNVRGALKLWKNGDMDEVGANIEHPALTTVSETIEADPNGVTVANNPVAWGSNALLTAVSGLAKNNVVSAAGSYNNKSLAYAVNADNLATVLQAGQTVNREAGAYYSGESWNFTLNPHYKGTVNLSISGRMSVCYYHYTDWWGGDESNVLVVGGVAIKVNGTTVYSRSAYTQSNPSSLPDPSFTRSLTITGGDTVEVSVPASRSQLPSVNYSLLASANSRIETSTPTVSLSDYISDLGFWLEYSDGSLERFPEGGYYTTAMSMTSPVSFNSSSYMNLNNCANILNYWSFTDSHSVVHTLQAGTTYVIESTGLYVGGNLVTGKYLTRNTSTVVLIYEYNAVRYSLNMESGGYYQVYGTIKIAQTDTKGVKMMGNYPKRDADDPQGGFDCGNSAYKWDNGYFKTLHYSNLNQGSTAEIKDIIGPYDLCAVDILRFIEVIRYTYKDDKKKKPKVGILANTAHPDISGEKRSVFELDHAVAILIKAVQEIASDLDKLKGGKKNA